MAQRYQYNDEIQRQFLETSRKITETHSAAMELMKRTDALDTTAFLDEEFEGVIVNSNDIEVFTMQIDRPALVHNILYNVSAACTVTIGLRTYVISGCGSIGNGPIQMVLLANTRATITSATALTTYYVEFMGNMLSGAKWSRV